MRARVLTSIFYAYADILIEMELPGQLLRGDAKYSALCVRAVRATAGYHEA